MRRIGIIGLSVCAAVALMGILAAGASASGVPTWSECAKAPKEGKTYLGHYSDKGCTMYVASGGKYELKEGLGKGKGFKGKGAAATLHVKTWIGDNTVQCTKSSETGTPALPNRITDVTVSFGGCYALGFKEKVCSSAGAKKGEVKISGLKGELGYVEESPVNVGLKLESEAHPGVEGELVSFTCPGLEITVRGGVIGVVKKDVNTVSKEFELVNTPGEFIGEHVYDGFHYKPLVNIVGWASEQAEIAKEIEEDEKGEIAKIERPIVKTVICGEFIESLLKIKCTPEAYAGLEGTIVDKGEGLMIKA